MESGQDIPLDTLDVRVQRYVRKAMFVAKQTGNLCYAKNIFEPYLDLFPYCTELRSYLREIQYQAYYQAPWYKKVFQLNPCFWFHYVRLRRLEKTDPGLVLKQIERLIDRCPKWISLHKLLAKVAYELKLWEAVALAYEYMLSSDQDTQVHYLCAQGEALIYAKQYERAIELGNRISKQFPGTYQAQTLMRKAAHLQAMQ